MFTGRAATEFQYKLEPLYSFAYDHQIDPSSTDAAVPLLDPLVNESAAEAMPWLYESVNY